MKNEQILYVPGTDISIDAGSGINERNFVKSLLDNGVNVLIPKPVNKMVLSDLNGYKNLKITLWCFNSKNPFSYLYHLYCQTIALKKIIKEKNIEVVVFRLGLVPLDLLYAKKALKMRVFLKHLTYLASSQKQNFSLKVIGIIRSFFVSRKLIDGCDTPSVMTKQYVEKHYGLKNIHIAKNGTSKNDFDIHTGQRNKDFIYIGRLSKGRNTIDLLEAFSKTNRTIDIFGFGELEDLANEYSNKFRNINYYGKVPYSEIVKILPNYKFGIDLTYVYTEFGKASYSQKIAQYLSFGLNTIAVECPDNLYIKENGCGVLFSGDTNDLVDLIHNIKYKDFNPPNIGEYIYADVIVGELIKFWKQ